MYSIELLVVFLSPVAVTTIPIAPSYRHINLEFQEWIRHVVQLQHGWNIVEYKHHRDSTYVVIILINKRKHLSILTEVTGKTWE